MPTYQYKCTQCDDRFDIEQSIHEDALTVLAGDDHEHQLKKVFSPVGISFRGDGFYRNDSRGSSKKSSSGSDAGSSDSTSSTSESSGSSDSSSSSDTASSSESKSSSNGSESSSSSTVKAKSSSDSD